jgi:hypothetical protein
MILKFLLHTRGSDQFLMDFYYPYYEKIRCFHIPYGYRQIPIFIQSIKKRNLLLIWLSALPALDYSLSELWVRGWGWVWIIHYLSSGLGG